MRKFAKIVAAVLVVLGLAMVAALVWSNHQLDKMYGGQVDVVDHTQFQPQSGRIAITNAHVLSPDGDSFVSGQTVLFEGSEILSVGPDSLAEGSDLAIDGSGTWVIPGLVDSHVHLFRSENDLLLYLANGITGIREMLGTTAHLTLRDEVRGGRIGPEMIVASNKLQSASWLSGLFLNWSQGNINMSSIDDAEDLLTDLEAQGYDAIKLGSHLSSEDYRRILEASGNIEIPLIGHLPYSIDIEDFWASDQKELAHIEELVKAFVHSYRDTTGNGDLEEFSRWAQTRVNELADKAAAHGISVTSTLWLIESFRGQKFDLESLLGEVELAHENRGIAEGTVITSRGLGWLPDVNLYRLPDDMDAEGIADERAYWARYEKAHHLMLDALVKRDVRIVAGTDANLPVVVPGFSLHDELVSLTNAGMTPAQALRSATANPAEVSGNRAGRIMPGYRSNLVLLGANPLVNITNTRTIGGVVANGRYFDQRLLTEMKDAVMRANQPG